MRRVAHRMGMPVSIDIPGAKNDKPFEAVFALLRDVDERFSPYKPASELCKIQAGQVAPADLSPEMRTVIENCSAYQKQTDGYFSPYFGGTFDPTGYVKGWAIAQAGALLERQGFGTYLINIAGDVLARSTDGHVWRIGLQHPQDAQHTMGAVRAANSAVATSGTSARGQHIINPHTGKPADELLSVTVVGSDIIQADVFATAVFAMGLAGLEFIAKQPGYEALLVEADLTAHTTAGFNTQTAQ